MTEPTLVPTTASSYPSIPDGPRSHAEFTLPPTLHLGQVGSLIELGIKFFLYQKGQLPVPFECLRTTDEKRLKRLENITIPSDLLNPTHRIRFLRQARITFRADQRRLQRSTLTIRKEIIARQSLQSTFDVCARLFGRCASISHDSLMSLPLTNFAISLAFGSTILNPKDVIVFRAELTTVSVPDENCTEKGLDMIKISKQFYKTLIMSEHFGPFLSTRLHRSSAHLNLLTKSPLPIDLVTEHGLVIHNNWNLPKDLHLSHTLKGVRGPGLFLVHITHPVTGTTGDGVQYWEDLNTYSSYKMPMSFKGM